jgi:hypothetical protein
MGGPSAAGDPLTRRPGEGLTEYLARLEALDVGALTEEQRRSLAGLIRAVRFIRARDQEGGRRHGGPPP